MPRTCGESSRSTALPIPRRPSERSVSRWRELVPLADLTCVITRLTTGLAPQGIQPCVLICFFGILPQLSLRLLRDGLAPVLAAEAEHAVDRQAAQRRDLLRAPQVLEACD